MTVDKLATNCNPVKWEEFLWTHDDKTKKLIDRHGIKKAFLHTNLREIFGTQEYETRILKNENLSVRAKRNLLFTDDKKVIDRMRKLHVPVKINKPFKLTSEHLNIIKDASLSSVDCAKVLPLSASRVRKHRRKLGIKVDPYEVRSRRYSKNLSFDDKLRYVKRLNYNVTDSIKKRIILDGGLSQMQKCKLLNCHSNDFYYIAKALGIVAGKQFSDSDMKCLNDEKITCGECAKIIGASYDMVHKYRKRNDIRIS